MSKTILLADDSVTIRKVVELTFMEEDYELVSLGSGEEALEQIPGIDPDLVIADVHMPGISGYEVCRKAKEIRSERPVLLLVGTFEPFDAGELEASGADAHLKKPFDSQELLQTVRDLVSDKPAVSEETGIEGEQELGDDSVEPLEGMAAVPGVGESETAGGFEPEWEPDAGARDAHGEADGDTTEPVEIAEISAELPAATVGTGGAGEEGALSDDAIERIAKRVAELLGPDAVRDVAWEVVPDLAEVVIKERLRELESQVE